ncbi:MAG: hypothetical protein HY392_02855, partial [Candidatus Diapherotrites archaeon]|nr:hypothetical protein [Candidatus Diapherotrites archaeon]
MKDKNDMEREHVMAIVSIVLLIGSGMFGFFSSREDFFIPQNENTMKCNKTLYEVSIQEKTKTFNETMYGVPLFIQGLGFVLLLIALIVFLVTNSNQESEIKIVRVLTCLALIYFGFAAVVYYYVNLLHPDIACWLFPLIKDNGWWIALFLIIIL